MVIKKVGITMQVNIKRNQTTRKVESADITGLTGENYVEIMLTLRLRQEYLEKIY